MSASTETRTPRKSLARIPNMGGPSIASCFGASVPVSPRRAGGHGLLGGQAFGNYKQLNGCDADEDEDEDEDEGVYRFIPTAQAERLNVSHRRQRSFSHFAGRQRPMREKGNHRDVQYSLEGEGEFSKERTASMKLGSHRSLREKPPMSFCGYGEDAPHEKLYESEHGCDEYSRERRGVRKLGKLWSMSRETGKTSSPTKTVEKEMYHGWGQGDADVCVEERNGGRKLGKQLWIRMSERARKGVYNAVKSKREEHDLAGGDQGTDEGGTGERKMMAPLNLQLGKQGSIREKEGLDAGSPRRESLCRKVKEACMQVLESARRSSPHVSELFVGNQLLMQVTSSSSLSARCGRNVAPSMGFLATGEAALSASMSGSPASSSTS